MDSTRELLVRLEGALHEDDLAPGTVAITMSAVARFSDWYRGTTGEDLDPALILAVDLADYRGWLQQRKMRPGSIRRHFAAIRKMLSLLAPERLTQIKFPKMPQERIDAPSGFSRNERNGILRACEGLHVRDAAIVKTLLYTGARASSVADLRSSDVDIAPRSGGLTFRGKGDRTYEVPANSELRRALRAYLEWRPHLDHDHFFCGLRHPHPPISRKVVHAVWHDLGRHLPVELGARIRGPHQARHDLARRLLSGDEGARPPAPLADVAAILGHANADPRITAGIYARPSRRSLVLALDRIVGDDEEE